MTAWLRFFFTNQRWARRRYISSVSLATFSLVLAKACTNKKYKVLHFSLRLKQRDETTRKTKRATRSFRRENGFLLPSAWISYGRERNGNGTWEEIKRASNFEFATMDG
eukprot:725603-Prorocentrum_minimum.AAC.2